MAVIFSTSTFSPIVPPVVDRLLYDGNPLLASLAGRHHASLYGLAGGYGPSGASGGVFSGTPQKKSSYKQIQRHV